MEKKEEKKVYNFGEKKEEVIKGKKVPVEFITPKYKEAKRKAIELLENEKYKGKLEESDFWILVNTYANGSKAMYSGLIISHDGCLKINDLLDDKLKFKPECISIDKEGYNKSLVFSYNCSDQGLYEVGEVNLSNCKNDYPYAMALKRCFDRVVLKNSKIAYSGIYSDSESDEITQRIEENNEVSNKVQEKATEKQLNVIRNKLEYDGNEEEGEAQLLKHYKIDKLEDLSMEQASELVTRALKNLKK